MDGGDEEGSGDARSIVGGVEQEPERGGSCRLSTPNLLPTYLCLNTEGATNNKKREYQ